jgi:hypothetical protein
VKWGSAAEAEAYKALELDKASLAELQAYHEAVKVRFGSHVFNQLARGQATHVPGIGRR